MFLEGASLTRYLEWVSLNINGKKADFCLINKYIKRGSNNLVVLWSPRYTKAHEMYHDKIIFEDSLNQ